MRTHSKLTVSAAVAATLAISPLADAHTIAVVVACNPGTPGAVSQMPAVSQGSASTATAVCPSGTYPAAAGLDGSQALLGAIGAAAAVGGGLALASGGGSSPASTAGQPALPGSGSGSGSNPAPGAGSTAGSAHNGAPLSGNGAPLSGSGGAASPGSAPIGSQGGAGYGRGSGNGGYGEGNTTGGGATTGNSGEQTYPVSAHPITGFPSPEISPTQLADYSATGAPVASVGSPSSNGGQSSEGQAGRGGGLGSFFGHLAHAVGATAQQIGHAIVTGGTVNIPLMGGASTHAQGTIAENGGNNTGNTGYSGFNSLNHYTQASPTAPVSIMTGAAPGTIEIHSQPQPFVLTGGPAAYRGLVRWVSGFEGSVLDVGGGYLDEVVHPGTVTPERQPDGPGRYVPFSRLSGTLDFYITEPGHRSIAYPGNPVRFVSQIAVGMGNINASIWEAAQKSEIQATGTYSSGPQYYTSMPGNRNGPFWPSPFTLGGPEPDVAGVCHGIRQITHVSMGGQCWSTTP
ncbi:hypothetical protein HMI48_01625 [Acidithiobacillus ferrooxidans]|uniref:hypothetical protein n=1 Tax=Acidithiobacillus ferrooxidans TaxID=920 RepID=UPI001C065866|nr:hypothetical protein [Acidithiobacillus ferrooxidans]MBU2772659.1 hypothetical protein [Acidithiobacillus ferrooxidans]